MSVTPDPPAAEIDVQPEEYRLVRSQYSVTDEDRVRGVGAALLVVVVVAVVFTLLAHVIGLDGRSAPRQPERAVVTWTDSPPQHVQGQ